MKIDVETVFPNCGRDCPRFEVNARLYFVKEELAKHHECVNLRNCQKIMEYLKNNFTVYEKNL